MGEKEQHVKALLWKSRKNSSEKQEEQEVRKVDKVNYCGGSR